jgi:hypothetical protein
VAVPVLLLLLCVLVCELLVCAALTGCAPPPWELLADPPLELAGIAAHELSAS